MTIQELYDWCKEHNATNSTIDLGHDMFDVIKDLSSSEEDYRDTLNSMCIVPNSNIHVMNEWYENPPKIVLF